jgi:uncharacterized short protein YbdD (DUF466 family)
MINREQLCKEFTELTGGHWHRVVPSNKYGNSQCSCGKVLGIMDFLDHLELNSTYENPADVLKVMMKRNDYDDFLASLQKTHWLEVDEFIEVYIVKPDTLLKAAIEFLKERRNRNDT